MPLRFNTLLADEGMDTSSVRLLRHQTRVNGRRTPYSLWRDDRDAFERYQNVQGVSRRAHLAAPYWASFVVPPNGETLFVGMYEAKRIGFVPPGAIDPLTGKAGEGGADQYDCRRSPILSEYIGRLFVRWGDSSNASHAWIQRADSGAGEKKIIIELTRSFTEESFPGFSTFARPLSEIEAIPPSWREILRVNRGVYLLACPRTREHYVGAAYGNDGFLGRWRTHAGTGGDSVELRKRDPSDYVISILEVVGSSASVEDIIALEILWKRKLLSRDIGLTRN
jgi:hypothetical protein